MSLFAEPFDASKLALPEIQSFECGTEIWCIHAANWIKCDDPSQPSAIGSMARFGTEVWLYRSDEDNDLVGFCALGTTNRKIGTRQKVSIIPQFAVHTRFQGRKLSYPILGDILAKALDHGTDLIVLEVHENNRAIEIYKRLRFKELPTRQRADHVSMVRVNREPEGHQRNLF